MAARIKAEFGVDSELVKGAAGVFDVEVDGDLLFSKHEMGRYPEDDEVVAELKRRS